MTPHQIVGLSVRLFSIWLLIFSLQINGYVSALNNQPGVEQMVIQYWLVGFVVLLAILLWFFPMAVAHKLIPKTQYQNTLSVPSQEMVHVACVIFSLWLFLVKLLPAVAYYIPLVIYISHEKHSSLEYKEFHFLKIAPLVIQFSMAAILAFRSRAISRFLLSLDGSTSKE